MFFDYITLIKMWKWKHTFPLQTIFQCLQKKQLLIKKSVFMIIEKSVLHDKSVFPFNFFAVLQRSATSFML